MGIDEAGRGPVLGPMVVAGVAFDRSSDIFFKTYGVKDSKQLSAKSRKEMFSLIEEEAVWYKVAVIWPETIDHFVSSNGLNHLECDVMAQLIDSIGIKTCVYVDSPLKPELFTQMLCSRSKIQSQINCCFKADTIYPVVSCASILAKVTRDRIIEELKSEYGDFGSGYPADEKTRTFLSKTKDVPFFVRKSWKTFKEIKGTLF